MPWTVFEWKYLNDNNNKKKHTLEDLCVQGVSKPGTVDTDIFLL